MDWGLIGIAVAALAGAGLLMGIILAVASIRFHVEVDPRVEQVRAVLPGANCGACGLPGCDAAAEAIVRGAAPPGVCTAGGSAVAAAVAAVLGVVAGEGGVPPRTTVRCQGGRGKVKARFVYDGVDACHAAQITAGGPLACPYGCLGLGDCFRSCKFGAIVMGEDGLPHIDLDKCTRCGLCLAACPRKIIAFLPGNAPVAVLCVSRDRGKTVREICTVGCIACGACVKACQPKAITLADNLAVIDYSLCDGCGQCVAKCPTKCLVSLTTPATPSGA
jgi:Na+-translocating ferredoxin:NAD+ oxidoreductase RNF subunit RnfB